MTISPVVGLLWLLTAFTGYYVAFCAHCQIIEYKAETDADSGTERQEQCFLGGLTIGICLTALYIWPICLVASVLGYLFGCLLWVLPVIHAYRVKKGWNR